jgi:hypothetical protein
MLLLMKSNFTQYDLDGVLHPTRIWRKMDKNMIMMEEGNPKAKWSLGRPSYKWEDNIRMDHREIGLVAMDLFHLTQNKDI